MHPRETMLILRGIAGTFLLDGAYVEYPDGALDEAPALEYAERRGYHGHVLREPGWTDGPDGRQVHDALSYFRNDKLCTALYGFSGGGYNLRHIIAKLSREERARLQLVVVLGAPRAPDGVFKGPWELVYRTDPREGHMYGPRKLLESLNG